MNIRILFCSLFFSGISVIGMQPAKKPLIDDRSDGKNSHYHYRPANQKDLSGLVELINTQAIHDRNKIVILPKQFRASALQSAIEKKRIFVAVNQDQIVGYKKLFMIENESEKSDILTDEIRCIDNEKNCTFAGFINHDGAFIEDKSPLPQDCYGICIYNGGDFTLPSHRGKGINQQLTNVALLSCVADIKKQIHDRRAKAITMVYGITKANAGEQPGSPSDRTPSISKSFKVLVNALENKQLPTVLQHRRYQAFMPTFDPESNVLKPLPDEQSIPGFGCVLAYQLRKSDE